jgi:hypothetical protein
MYIVSYLYLLWDWFKRLFIVLCRILSRILYLNDRSIKSELYRLLNFFKIYQEETRSSTLEGRESAILHHGWHVGLSPHVSRVEFWQSWLHYFRNVGTPLKTTSHSSCRYCICRTAGWKTANGWQCKMHIDVDVYVLINDYGAHDPSTWPHRRWH